DPTKPELVPLPALPVDAARIALSGSIAVAVGAPVVPGDAAVERAVIDLSAPAAPRTFLAPFASNPLAFAGPRLVVAQPAGLDLFDVSAGRGALLVTRNEAGSGHAVSATADRVAVLNAHGVLLLRAADLAPQAFVPAPDAEQAALDESHLYV